MQSKPNHTTTFEAKIRDEWLVVDGQAWSDHEGIYQTRIAAVWMEDVNVLGLLTLEDRLELDAMIPDAIANDNQGE